jgi:hypothetical protein
MAKTIFAKMKREPKARRRNPGQITKKLHNNMIRLWKDAVKQFLRFITYGDLVRVDTGMSKSSLLPLAKAAGGDRLKQEIRATILPLIKRKPRRGYTDMEGVYHPEQLKSPSHGEQLGRRAFSLTFGSQYRPVMRFRFDIVVYQYFLHENFWMGGQSTGPWESLNWGLIAFNDYLENNWRRYIPDILRWLVSGEIRN